MHVVHVYDGHEAVYDGRGSVPGVVWNVARETANAGHDVTVIERQWAGLAATAEHDGVRFRRIDLSTGADEPWTRVPYEEVHSPVGLARLVGDRTNFAAQTLRILRGLEYDVLHVHLPFAANVLATVAPWLRRRMVYTAHLGELRLNAIDRETDRDGADDARVARDAPDDARVARDGPRDDDRVVTDAGTADGTAGRDESGVDGVSVPAVLQYLSPDRLLARRVARTTVLNPEIREAFVDLGVPQSRLAVVPNGVDVERFAAPPADVLERVSERYDLAGRRTVLFVGTVMPRKGVDDLVRAMAAVVNGAPAGEVDPDDGTHTTTSNRERRTADPRSGPRIATPAGSDRTVDTAGERPDVRTSPEGREEDTGPGSDVDAAEGRKVDTGPGPDADRAEGRNVGMAWGDGGGGGPPTDATAGHPDATLVIAGETDLDSEYADRIDRLVRASGLADRVVVTGFVPEPELPALYATADVFALPSREEGFGMTVVEAMAAGTPVVATTVGDVPRIVEAGRHGLLVEPGDVDALAGGIARLLGAPRERRWMGRQARERAETYSWRSVAEQFESVYGSIA